MVNGCILLNTKSALCNIGRAMCGLQLPFQVIIFISVFGKLGSAERPMVTFNPEWNKILLGQSISMSCNVEPEALSYRWYHNNSQVSTGRNYKIPSAETGHSGDYKCWASTGNMSEIVTLSVSIGPVILQAPLYIYEGENTFLRCYSPYEGPATQTTFYKNNEILKKTASNNLLFIEHTDPTATYRCSKHLPITKTYSAETNISYTVIPGTIPVTVTPAFNTFLTGDNLTMTCHGEDHLTYHWLQNGRIVAEKSVYSITFAQVGHSGFYQCLTSRGHSVKFWLEVSNGPLILQAPVFVYWGIRININCLSRPGYSIHTTTFYKNNQVLVGLPSNLNTVTFYGEQRDVSGRYKCERELSRDEYVTDEVSLHVRGKNDDPWKTIYIILIILIILVFIITSAVSIVAIKYRCKPQPTSSSTSPTLDPPVKEAPNGIYQEGDVCYAKINHILKASLPKATENQVVYSEIKAKVEP